MNEENLKFQIGLTLIPGIGSINAKKLIAYVGSPEGIFKESKLKLMKIPGIGEYIASEIVKFQDFEKVENEIEFCKTEKITPVFYLNKDFPERLKNYEDSPILLFVKGKVDFNKAKILSIIGTRNATNEGKGICELLVSDLKAAGHNPIIVSGLAYGIDICAHKAALKNQLETIAVLGHGLDILYPAQHKGYADKIENQGALITEFLSKSRIDKQNFVRRNRIVAGISDATIIVESADKGGALITAEIANAYNKDVFAFPGRVSDKFSAGCNKLIKIQKARLIESYKDIEYILGWEGNKKTTTSIQTSMFHNFTDDDKIIINILNKENNLTIDAICSLSNFQMSKVSSMLLNLEFSGIIKCLPGKIYTITNSFNF